MRINESGVNEIEKENWRKAEGIIDKKDSNSALARRDYSKDCKLVEICCLKGYFIWWCSAHHQPYSQCKHEKIEQELNQINEMLKKLGM